VYTDIDTRYGISGCRLELTSRGSQRVIRKTPSRKMDMRPFGDKMKQAGEQLLGTAINVPGVYLCNCDAIEYEYVQAHNYIAAMQRMPLPLLCEQLRRLPALVDVFMKRATMSRMNSSIHKQICNKLGSVEVSIGKRGQRCAIVDSSIASAFTILLESWKRREPVPIGFCHGDLTLSNALFMSHAITLIDWSPTFIDTPLLDWIKLRQDTLHYWTSFISPMAHSTITNTLLCEQVNTQLRKGMSTAPGPQPDWTQLCVFRALEILNYLRILPYTDNPRIIIYVHTILEELL
jgi:hypothetical protein